MVNITKHEAAFLNWCAYSEMNSINGARPTSASEVCTWLWLDEMSVDAGITVQQGKGVLSSLVQKGLVWTTDEGEDSGIGFTDEGYAAWETVDAG